MLRFRVLLWSRSLLPCCPGRRRCTASGFPLAPPTCTTSAAIACASSCRRTVPGLTVGARQAATRALRREVEGATALELTRAEFEALARDSSVAHISQDLPVVADMAVTNKVTRADASGQGTPRPPRHRLDARLQGSGHRRRGDRLGHRAAQRHRQPRRGPRQFRLDRAGRHRRPVRPRHARRGHDRRRSTAQGHDLGLHRRQRPAVQVHRRARARPHRHRLHERRPRRHRLGHRQPRRSTASASSICRSATRSPNPPSTDPLCIAVERAVKAGIVVVASAGNYGLTSTGAKVLGGITSPGNSPAAITVGALDTKGTADRVTTTWSRLTARAVRPAIDLTVKPDVVAPGHPDRVARVGRFVSRADLSAVARRRQRHATAICG